MHKVCFFDITAENVEKMQHFYSELFGWKFKKFDQAPQGYWFIHPHDSSSSNNHSMSQANMCEEKTGAALGKKMGPHKGFLNYFSVENIDQHIEKVKELGGTIITPKNSTPGFGYMVLCNDPEDNVFALWEDNKDAT